MRTDLGWFVLDFEGEPARAVDERRRFTSPLKDVAGMLRSFHYAEATGLRTAWVDAIDGDSASVDDAARAWSQWVSATFMRGYLDTARDGGFLPPDPDELERLLFVHRLDKAVYELGYEIDHRPDWVSVPARGILEIVGDGPA